MEVSNLKPWILSEYKNGRRHFEDLDIDNEYFDNEDLSGVKFDWCRIYASFNGANLANCSFTNGGVKTCDFRNADLTNARFEYVCIESAVFKGAKVDGVVFVNNSCYSQEVTQEEFDTWIKDLDI